MTTAIIAAREKKKVCIIEKMDKAGKKLLATGNGKCNFTNENISADCFGTEPDFIRSILERFGVKECLEFFHSIGICPRNKNGYYYPNSEQAVSVVNALLSELKRLDVPIYFQTKIGQILPQKDGILVTTDHGDFLGKNVVISTGLKAAPKLGSDGSMFPILKELGHSLHPVLPALCGFYCKGTNFKNISGVRAQGTVCAVIDGVCVREDSGEIQFTDYGLSGIPVFQISRDLSKALHEKKHVQIKCSLSTGFDKNSLLAELRFRKAAFASQTAEFLLNGLIHQKLAALVLEKTHIDKLCFVSSLQENDLRKIADSIEKLTFEVTKYRDYEFAQVCTGGIPITEIRQNTLESKRIPHMFFTGEILDVDGICGGYNLHFAWASGYIVGKSL